MIVYLYQIDDILRQYLLSMLLLEVSDSCEMGVPGTFWVNSGINLVSMLTILVVFLFLADFVSMFSILAHTGSFRYEGGHWRALG